jgi:hypothetical protein
MLVRSTSRATAAASVMARNVSGHIGLVALGELEEHLLSTRGDRAVVLSSGAHVDLGYAVRHRDTSECRLD